MSMNNHCAGTCALNRVLSALVLACGSLLLVPSVSQAATLDSTPTVTLETNGGTCATSTWTITFSLTATQADAGSSGDQWGFYAFDGNGVPISADWTGTTVGGSVTRTTDFGNGDQINAMTARPLTVVFVDTLNDALPGGTNGIAQYDAILNARNAGDPVLATLIYDVANDVADCANLPLTGIQSVAATGIPTMSTYGLVLIAFGLLLAAIRRLRMSARRR